MKSRLLQTVIFLFLMVNVHAQQNLIRAFQAPGVVNKTPYGANPEVGKYAQTKDAKIYYESTGYLLGYWSGRLLKLDEATCRTISLEVGMQNAGLASGIAIQMGKVATVGLASAIAAPWMTISGSLLANWWRNKSLKEDKMPIS